MRRSRRTSIVIAALGLVAGALVPFTATSQAHADTSHWPVPAVPAQQPGLVMDCAAGQVDLNHATLQQLQTLPGVSAPIAQRIIDTRPHDRTKDLLVVPGIGPDKLAAIEAGGTTCSTPLTLPPPSANVCTTSGQLDVNDPASQSGLADLFGAPTAQRLVDARPYPDLAHAKVVLAAGAGPGKVAKYAAQLCATPVPKTTAGVNYSYIYSAKGGRADLGKFALVVPPATLTDPVGQWLRITPQQTPTTALAGPAWPSAEFSVLDAPWSNGSKYVYVTLPIDPELAEFGDTATPVVAHWSDPDRSGGAIPDSRTDTAAGTITAAVTHLSVLDSISQGVSWVFEPLAGLLLDARFPAPTCDGSWSLDTATGSWTKTTAHVDLIGSLLNLPGNTVPPFGWPQKHCVESAVPGSYDAKLNIVNNTRTFESLTHYSGDGAQLGYADPIGADPLQLIITGASELVLKHPVAYPGADVSATVTSGQRGAVRMTPNIPITALWAIVHETPINDALDNLGSSVPAATQIIKDNLACVLSALNVKASLDEDGAVGQLDAFTGLLKDCIDFEGIRASILEAEHNGLISPDKVGKFGVILNKLQRYVLWLKAGRIAVTSYDTWLGYAGGSSAGIIDIENHAPKPLVDSLGRRIHDPCVSEHGLTWTIDMNCQNAYYAARTVPSGGGNPTPAGLPPGKILRDTNGHAWVANLASGVIRPIADGGTYLCLAKHYPVDWDARLGDYTDLKNPGHFTFDSTPASCDDSLPDDRPINNGQTDATTIVLRQADGTAWVIWNGQRDHIQTGDEFRCWVDPQYAAVIEFDVWDQVTTDQLNHWPIATNFHVSNCGDPTHPTF